MDLKSFLSDHSKIYSFSLLFFIVFVELFSTLKLCSGANPQVSFLARRCFCRFELHEKRSPHPSHLYSLTPSCASSWCLQSVGFLNALPQWEHVYGFSPVWIRMWAIRLLLLLKILPHVSHVKASRSVAPCVCFFMCLLNAIRPTNRDSQILHA